MSTADLPVIARELWESEKLTLTGIDPNLPDVERSKVVRDATKSSTVMSDRLGLVQGELLYEIRKRDYWKAWGYGSFDEYIEKELEFKRRKAYYLMQIYEKFVLELGLPIERLKDIEWAKAKELVPVITPENWEGLLEKVENMTVSEVRDYVKELKGAKKPEEEFVRRIFMLTAEQEANVVQALTVASKITGSEKSSNLLDIICTEFLSSNRADLDLSEFLDAQLKAFEHAIGAKIQVIDVDETILPKYSEESGK